MTHHLNCNFGSFITVDPFRCRVWRLNNRMEDYVTETSCRAEIESIARDGQLIPVIARRIDNDRDYDHEVICGMRRLFVAQHLKVPLRIEVRDLTDQQAAVAVETENSLRKQISPYERGLWFSKLLAQNVYRSQDEMAQDLGVTPTQVSRLLKFPELPSVVLRAFASPHDILESWAIELHKACKDERRDRLMERARSLERHTPHPPAVSIYEMLLAVKGPMSRQTRSAQGRVIKGPMGQHLLRFERQRKEVVLRIPNALLDATTENAMTQAIVAVLTRKTHHDRVDAA